MASRRRHAGFLGKLHQQRKGFAGDAVLRVIQIQAGGFQREGIDPLGSPASANHCCIGVSRTTLWCGEGRSRLEVSRHSFLGNRARTPARGRRQQVYRQNVIANSGSGSKK
jgi:hypothetical protein